MVTERATNPAAGQSPPRLVPSTRFLLALLVFFAFVVQYSQRVNVAMAIVCMVNRTQPINSSSVAAAYAKGLPYNASKNFVTSTSSREPLTSAPERRGFFQTKQFFWDEEKQQDLLGGYWAGYIFTQIPGEYRDLFVFTMPVTHAVICKPRWLVSDNFGSEMGLCLLSRHQFLSDVSNYSHVSHVKLARGSDVYPSIRHRLVTRRAVSSHYCALESLGCSEREKYPRLDRLLRHTSGHIFNDAVRRIVLPVPGLRMDVSVHCLGSARFRLADTLDRLDRQFAQRA